MQASTGSIPCVIVNGLLRKSWTSIPGLATLAMDGKRIADWASCEDLLINLGHVCAGKWHGAYWRERLSALYVCWKRDSLGNLIHRTEVFKAEDSTVTVSSMMWASGRVQGARWRATSERGLELWPKFSCLWVSFYAAKTWFGAKLYCQPWIRACSGLDKLGFKRRI